MTDYSNYPSYGSSDKGRVMDQVRSQIAVASAQELIQVGVVWRPFNPNLKRMELFTPRSAAAGLSNWFCPASGVCKKKLKLLELEPTTISKHEGDDQIRRILACVYLVEQYSGYILSIFSLSDYQCLPPFLIRSSVTPTAWIRSYSITVYYR